MLKVDTLKRIEDSGAMAIVRTETSERGIEIAQACIVGGVDVLEVSYTLPNAGTVIKDLVEKFGDKLLVGAGTVLDIATARMAMLAGAKFIVAPNYNEGVAKICNLYQIAYMPGCTTMSEITNALEAGAAAIKLFPVANYFGPSIMNVIKTTMPFVPAMPSGGVTFDNLEEWIKNGAICVGVGSLLAKGSKEQITANAKKFRESIDKVRAN
ncbi:MAG TPA: ketohydroxyglutarate aldolase [Clostridium sp.]